MSQQDPNLAGWLPWLASIPGAILLFFVKRILNSVSREELRQAIRDSERVRDDRHQENVGRFKAQDLELQNISKTVSRIEGQLSGRYPTLPGKRGQ